MSKKQKVVPARWMSSPRRLRAALRSETVASSQSGVLLIEAKAQVSTGAHGYRGS